jgi:tRNA 2-selenouridine synthase
LRPQEIEVLPIFTYEEIMGFAIEPRQFLDRLSRGESIPSIDVRSEGEFGLGAIPGFTNQPILNNEERHLIGIEYKQHGQPRAIELGHKLVEPNREVRVASWLRTLGGSTGVVSCWRGGLRSKIAAEWMGAKDAQVSIVTGGYKALRRELLSLMNSPPPLTVIAGWTGSGKTKLIEDFNGPKLDLEKLAHHRGSCFGDILDVRSGLQNQPSQGTFENAIGLSLWNQPGPVIVEDESTRIGSLNIANTLKNKMRDAPVIFVEATILERATNIFEGYISKPFEEGIGIEKIRDYFLSRLHFIHRHLGGKAFEEIRLKISLAFVRGLDPKDHIPWIEDLLVQHYDKAYSYSFEKTSRKILFKGSRSACLEFLKDQPTR